MEETIEISKTVILLWIGFGFSLALSLVSCWKKPEGEKELPFKIWITVLHLICFAVAGYAVLGVDRATASTVKAQTIDRKEAAATEVAEMIQNNIAAELLKSVGKIDEEGEIEAEVRHIVAALTEDWKFAAQTSHHFPDFHRLSALVEKIESLRNEIQEIGSEDTVKLRRILKSAENSFKQKTEIP